MAKAKKSKNKRAALRPLILDYDLLPGDFAFRVDEASHLKYNDPPTMVIKKNPARGFDLVVTYNLTPEHTGPKKIHLQHRDAFLVSAEGDIYDNDRPPTIEVQPVAGGFSQIQASPIITTARKVQHGS